MSRDLLITSWFLVGAFGEGAVLEPCAGADQRDLVGCVERTPPGLCGLDELQRHRDAGGAGAGPLGDALAEPDGGDTPE